MEFASVPKPGEYSQPPWVGVAGVAEERERIGRVLGATDVLEGHHHVCGRVRVGGEGVTHRAVEAGVVVRPRGVGEVVGPTADGALGVEQPAGHVPCGPHARRLEGQDGQGLVEHRRVADVAVATDLPPDLLHDVHVAECSRVATGGHDGLHDLRLQAHGRHLAITHLSAQEAEGRPAGVRFRVGGDEREHGVGGRTDR